jgi:hypothetical protein
MKGRAEMCELSELSELSQPATPNKAVMARRPEREKNSLVTMAALNAIYRQAKAISYVVGTYAPLVRPDGHDSGIVE